MDEESLFISRNVAMTLPATRSLGRHGFGIRRILHGILSTCSIDSNDVDGNPHCTSGQHCMFHTEPTRVVHRTSDSRLFSHNLADFTPVLFSGGEMRNYRPIHTSTAVAVEELPGYSSSELRVTKAAVDKIKELQKKRQDPDLGLRLLVSGGGCSGFQYVFEIEKNVGEGDHVLEEDGVRVVCDEVSLNFVRGSTIDYESDLIQSKFVVSENPNAEIGCGCGSSFGVQMS